LQRQAGLAHPSHPGQRDGPGLAERRNDPGQLALATDERTHLQRQIAGESVQRAQGREPPRQIGMAKLVQRLGLPEVPQPVLSHVDQLGTFGEPPAHQQGGHTRNQHLPTMTGAGEPGRPVHRRPVKIAVTKLGVTGVQSHSHPQLTAGVPGGLNE
jgi:hypothetical protein